jgi:hypothetical protein
MAATSFWMEDRVDTTSFELLESRQQDEERHGRSALNRSRELISWIE